MRPDHSLRKQNICISNVSICRICHTNTKNQSRTLCSLSLGGNYSTGICSNKSYFEVSLAVAVLLRFLMTTKMYTNIQWKYKVL